MPNPKFPFSEKRSGTASERSELASEHVQSRGERSERSELASERAPAGRVSRPAASERM
jgi:hypothetical protein